MAEPTPPAQPSAPATPPAAGVAETAAKVPERNRALRMLGLPALPKKLPSRNWMIFWTLSTAISAGIIYDKREKKRAIAKWRHAVEHLAKEPLPNHNALSELRKITVYLSAPPGDGLRTAQDHYTEYVKPILAASGLDWEFVQGRRDGDVRAYTAEKIRRHRKQTDNGEAEPELPEEPTKEEIIAAHRKLRGIKDYEGIKGDIVIGRHTWKEYLRGLHEGWLGPLTAPPIPVPEPVPTQDIDGEKLEEDKKKEEEAKKKEEETKSKRPPQPRPYNTPADYASSPLPPSIPNELSPVAPVREPHLLGFLSTPTRMYRFFNRRRLADEIGRDVAAVCLAHYRHFSTQSGEDQQYEQERELAWEEKDWVKTVWKEAGDEPEHVKEREKAGITEVVRAKPLVLDPRIAERMRRFELTKEDEERVAKIAVPEEEIEGWTKGKFRQLYRWGKGKVVGEEKRSNVEDVD
ncbi:putative mitochondrial import inner membrane translocase subunit tim-54 [Triangularia verruculosa]|uniref:Mitochondrial import inner membrane translocase subunit TIM54 n=1 Tax=Triangularia verruculosa TaxID=2587418 RepID=A0AAN7AUL5_9PEZI|nr:putative mitochondrial import inner membrane translocase subunit tim-54 [Triangularia verruculosa]